MEDKKIISKEELHNFRKEIDKCIKQAQMFILCDFVENGNTAGKRENALVITKLQEAKMWAGKVLEATGNELPDEFRDNAN